MASLDPRHIADDIFLCVGFFTRVPLPGREVSRRFAEALWAAPLAGVVVGIATGLALLVPRALGLPAEISAALALAAGIMATGALHEDGLADVADGFGGGRDRDAKLAIMRDSRIGTYGVVAVVLSLLLRWGALSALAALPSSALLGACIAAHVASRALLPAFIAAVPPARADGLGAGVGAASTTAAGVALLIGIAALLFSPGSLPVALAVLALLFFGLDRLCRAQVGGQTGDVLGALQQVAETAIFLLAVSTLGTTA